LASRALGGLILAVGGSLLATTFGQTNHAVVGLILGLFAALARDLASVPMTRLETIALLTCTGLFFAALATSSFAPFVTSAMAGGGFGSAFPSRWCLHRTRQTSSASTESPRGRPGL